MDKEQILQVLEQGASFWNSWRKQQAKDEINLDGIVLEGMNFNGYDFSKVSFCNAQVTHCSFQYADLIFANLQEV